MGIILVFLLLGGAAYYFMKPEERARVGHALLACLRGAKEALLRRWKERGAPDEGRPRDPLPLATAAIVIVNVLVFVDMLVGDGVLADEGTLVSWGANFGPRTTNGEWWRVVGAMFVHSGFLHLAADLCGLALIGVIVERLVGSFAFTTVYFVSGIFASLVSLSEFPVGTNIGASGAIFGIYGLLLAVGIWGLIQRSPIKVPLDTLKVVAPPVALFLLYSAATDRLGMQADVAGFVSGFICGLVLSIGSEERKPAVRRVAAVTGATAILALAFAVPLRGLADVRPEIARIVALEARTAGVYQAAVKRFSAGNIQVRALADLIDGTVAPDLQAARARLKSFEHVPPEHQPLVAAADEYLRLRDESWRLRSAALRQSNMRALQKADRSEWRSLEAFEQLKQMSQK